MTRGAEGAAVLIVIGVAAAASAQPAESLEYLRLEDLMEIQVRVPSKLELRVRDAPTVGAAITREEIESYGWLSANDALFKQPGFAAAQDYERVTVGARGLSVGWDNNHLLMLVDGVPHNNNYNLTAYTWEITPLYLAQTLELTRGPGSALYGSTAMNGIVALNTVSPSNDRPGEAMVRFGNAGTRTYDLMVGHVFKPFSFVAVYNHFETDGNSYSSFDGSGRADASGALQQFQTNDRRSSDYAWAKIEALGKLRGLSLQAHYQQWKFGTGHGWLFIIPDQPDDMGTNVESLTLRYQPPALLDERLEMDWVLMWQRQEVSYDVQFYPTGTMGFPDGLREILDSETNVLFARGQVSYRLWREMTLLAGVENRTFLYFGDHEHTANADLTSGATLAPFPGNQQRPLPDVFEPAKGRPVDNVGIYAQLATGRILRRIVSVTAGLRYDVQTSSYVDITQPGRPIHDKNFQQASPRGAILFYPWRDLVLKAMVERAFRAPAPIELFGANTYLFSSNINRIRPEELTSTTLAADLTLLGHLNLRCDWYWQKYDNPIDFSAAGPNLTTNLFTLTVTGIESEILFDAPISATGVVSGFANYSWAHQLEQQIRDVTISAGGELPWYPEHVFNFGVAFNGHGFGASIQGHYQGQVLRRPSDSIQPDGTISPFAAYRPTATAMWFTLDARLSYRITDWLRVGVQATNLADTRGYYLKTNRFPFDYRIQPVRVLGTLEVSLKRRGPAN